MTVNLLKIKNDPFTPILEIMCLATVVCIAGSLAPAALQSARYIVSQQRQSNEEQSKYNDLADATTKNLSEIATTIAADPRRAHFRDAHHPVNLPEFLKILAIESDNRTDIALAIAADAKAAPDHQLKVAFKAGSTVPIITNEFIDALIGQP
jgi:hypothetical protein